jgi:hypothetical protein
MVTHPHLSLGNPINAGKRRKRAGGGGHKRPEGRDPRTFALNEMAAADGIAKAHGERRTRFSKFLDPKLIFKLETNQPISPDELTERLQSAKARPLYIPPRGEGVWIVFADEGAIDAFKERLSAHAKDESYKFFNAVRGIRPLDAADRVGERLAEALHNAPGALTVDVELWRMLDSEINATFEGLRRIVAEGGGAVLDTIIRRSFAEAKVKGTADGIRKILDLNEVAFADLPPRYLPSKPPALSAAGLMVGPSPPLDSPAIVVLDSGIAAAHPILEPCVREAISLLPQNPDPGDDSGHGTAVASVAAYGDLSLCLQRNRFNPSVWIHSIKVLKADEFGQAFYDDTRLLTKQIVQAVTETMAKHARARIFVLAFGDEDHYLSASSRQFPVAAVVDELAHEYDAVFVVPTGNADQAFPLGYPDSLLLDGPAARIISPGSSALALTVGSHFNRPPEERRQGQLSLFPSPTFHSWPSPFTRAGPGLNDMVKPDFIEFGGAGVAGSPWDDVTVANRAFLSGPQFDTDSGTSFSAPRVAYAVGQLMRRYPEAGANLCKALLLLSARLPDERPGRLADLDPQRSGADFETLARVYGWGIPRLPMAAESDDSRVILTAENRLGLDKVHVYSISVPPEWMNRAGRRGVRVALAYNPPTAEQRGDYLGLTLDFSVFVGADPEDIAATLAALEPDTPVPADLDARQLNLKPGPQARNRGPHQVASLDYTNRPRWDASQAISIAVRCKGRWVEDEHFLQHYALAVQLHHEGMSDLFVQVRALNQAQLRARARA